MKNSILFGLILSLLGGLLMNCGKITRAIEPDLLLVNGNFWTVSAAAPKAEALAIAGDKIIAVGTTAEILRLATPKSLTIDLNGKLVLPGFNDAHLHFASGGSSLLEIQLRDARDEADFARRIAENAARLPKIWITGGNWDHEAWPSQKFPNKSLIDPVTPETPVLVSRLDGHVALANSLALRLAQIDKSTPDPQGGKIDRDPTTGEPTGILWDEAIVLVGRVIPPQTQPDQLRAIQAALQHAAELGVTSVQDNSSQDDLKIYQQLLRQNKLTVRINAWRPVDLTRPLTQIGLEMPFGNPMLRLGTVKIFSDGSMGAGSAWFFAPYADDPTTSGLAMYSVETLNQIIELADAGGLQIATHAIGDRANHEVLNAYEQALKKNRRQNARHRIEHAQVIQAKDLPRFKELGVIASIQPSHCIDDMRWAEKRIGQERCQGAYRFKSVADAGAQIAFGTDWPVEPLDPLLGLYAAVTREFPEGGPENGWHSAEKLSLEQAIEFYTLGSAYAEFAENEKGTLEVGKLADLVVLSKNLFEIPPQEILTTKVLLTLVGGKIVHQTIE
jgi:predicted amidohydrolase YtcJ